MRDMSARIAIIATATATTAAATAATTSATSAGIATAAAAAAYGSVKTADLPTPRLAEAEKPIESMNELTVAVVVWVGQPVFMYMWVCSLSCVFERASWSSSHIRCCEGFCPPCVGEQYPYRPKSLHHSLQFLSSQLRVCYRVCSNRARLSGASITSQELVCFGGGTTGSSRK